VLPHLVPLGPPAEEPVGLLQAKAHCRVTHSEEDVLLASYITAARQLCEALTNRCLVSTEFQAYWPRFEPGAPLNLGLPGVTAVASLQRLDEAGALQLVGADVWTLDDVAEPARLVLQPDQQWPAADTRRPNAVRARFTAGWATADAVPMAIRTWVLMHVQAMHERACPYGERLDPLPYLNTLIAPYGVTRWGS
jgi:uncharacterized phiE125 gp8 family phage protein